MLVFDVHRHQLDRLVALAVDLVEPGRRVVYIGLSGGPSLLDTRALVLKDVTAVGVLSASGGLADGVAEAAAEKTKAADAAFDNQGG